MEFSAHPTSRQKWRDLNKRKQKEKELKTEI